MKKLQYILSLVVLVCSCTQEIAEINLNTYSDKVSVDFNIQVNDASVATKAMADKPQLKNLMLAVFDETGYLVEYTWAVDGTQYAAENGTRYLYKAYLTQSKTPRIIHFIGNAPQELKFGTEEVVLASLSSALGSNSEDMYWYRKVIPAIEVTNSGGAMALADEDDAGPILQATPQTLAHLNDIPLIRNFAKIVLTSSSEHFTLDSYFVVGTPKTGMAAAYNYSKGEFVDYFTYKDSDNADLLSAGIQVVGDPKTYQYLTVTEKYDANVPANSSSVTLTEASQKPVSGGASYFVYEREKPLSADAAAYIIAYGTYAGDNKQYYYKIDLRDKDGYFPILRNFQYNVDITTVSRAGYNSIEEAAKSAGSGDISSSMETISLAYISDGVASLEVDYTEMYLISDDEVSLGFTFLSDVNDADAYGSVEDIWIKVNEAGSTGAAIATVNGSTYAGQDIKPEANPGIIKIKPTTPTDTPKTQTLTIYARYKNAGAEHILQRTVKYIVQTKREMVVALNPYDVPETKGAEFDLTITIPGGLSSSIFPLEFAIEAEQLSINPGANEQMPVQTGKSITGSGKSSFYFIKTLQKDEYVSANENVITCHFKTSKATSASKIFVLNDYFTTKYLENTGNAADNDGNCVYLGNYKPSTFSDLKFSKDPVACVEDVEVNFTFNMSAKPADGKVKVSLGGLKPADETDESFNYVGIENGYAVYEYTVSSTSGSLALMTADDDTELYVGLDAYHFLHAEETAARQWAEFTGSLNKGSLGTDAGEAVNYTLTIPQSGYYADMVVTVKFDGLDFSNGEPNDGKWTDKGNGVYEYRPTSAGNTILNLATTIAGERTDKVTLTAPGFRPYESEIEQLDALKVTINRTISGEINDFRGWDNSNTQFTATITTSGATPYTATGNISRDGILIWYTYEYSLSIQNWNVEYIDANQSVTVTLVHSGNTYTGTCTLRQLINGNVSLDLD